MFNSLFITFLIINLGVAGVKANDEVDIQTKVADILDLSKKPIYTPATQFGGKGYALGTESWGNEDAVLGYKYRFPVTTREILRYEDKIIYDKTYNIVSELKRFIPQASSNPSSGRITLMGCSYVFGVGLDDDETIMANLSRLMPSYEIDNLALIGSGPNITLAYLEERNYQAPKHGKEDIYIYVYSEAEHLTRANGFMIPLEWMGTSPHYELIENNGARTMKRQGTIIDAHPLRAKLLNWMRNYVSIALGLDYDFPPIVDSHREYVCNLFEQMNKVILSHNPKAKFYIQYYNFGMPPKDYYHRCFAERGISELPLKLLESRSNLHPHDAHPNEKGALKIAQFIKEALDEVN